MINSQLDYSPSIYLISCTLVYCAKKDKLKYERAKSKKQKEKYLKRLDVKELVVVLDDNLSYVSDKMHNSDINRIWSKYKIRGNKNDYYKKIININVISKHGKINYKFNPKIH